MDKTNVYSAKSHEINHGHFYRRFTPGRGIKQGFPVSTLLFILVLEVLSNRIKNSDLKEGINMVDKTTNISKIANDTICFVQNIISLNRLLNLIE